MHDSINSKFIIEEFFYDAQNNLVDADHYNLDDKNLELKYAHLKRKNIDGEVVTYFYNAKGDKVGQETLGELITWTIKKNE